MMGGAGDPPAPVGDPPTGRSASTSTKRRCPLARAVASVPSGGSLCYQRTIFQTRLLMNLRIHCSQSPRGASPSPPRREHVFSARSAAVLGSSHVSTPKTLARVQRCCTRGRAHSAKTHTAPKALLIPAQPRHLLSVRPEVRWSLSFSLFGGAPIDWTR